MAGLSEGRTHAIQSSFTFKPKFHPEDPYITILIILITGISLELSTSYNAELNLFSLCTQWAG